MTEDGHPRRELLALLVGAGGGLAGCLGPVDDVSVGPLDDDSTTATTEAPTTGTTPATTTPGGDRSALDRIQERVLELRGFQGPIEPTLEFDYGEREVEGVDDESVESVRARADADLGGDRLLLVPGAVEPAALRERLAFLWKVPRDVTETATVEGEPVTFSGGESGEYAYLLGVVRGQGAVAATRGESLSVARRLTDRFD